jgi:aspartate aminotransferase
VPTPSLSQHAVIARPSPTLGISAKAAAMKAKGLDVISLSVGEPDFNTPEPIRSAAIAAMNEGLTKYTPSTGLPKLKQTVAKKFTEENGFAVEPSDVVITVGAKHAIFNALWVTVGPGDEVILLAPYWMTYLDQVNLCGAKAKVVMSGPESGYIPSIEDIKAAITPNTKALLLNSPSNPTGAVYPPELIRQIAELAVEHNFWLISDEIYEKLIYDDAKLLSPASISPDVQERTITVNGCSKTFSMTGWRIGYLTGPSAVVKSISNFQDQVTSNPTSFAQIGALAALEMDPELVEGMRIEFDKRRKFAAELLRQIPNLGVIEPKGAFYFFLDMSKFLGKEVADDTALCDKFLEEAHVAMVPGSVFEGPGCMRMSYAVSMEQLEKGISRMAEVLSRF